MTAETGSDYLAVRGLERYGFSVEQYRQIVAAGVIPPHERVELVSGQLYRRPQAGTRQAYVIKHLVRKFSELLPDGYHVQSRLPVALWDGVIEPDIAVVRGSPDDYRLRVPVVSEAPLVIEVAERNAVEFRLGHQAAYLASGMAEAYWVVDAEKNEVVVHYDGQPIAGDLSRFNFVQRYRGPQPFAFRLAGWTVAELRTDDLLPA